MGVFDKISSRFSRISLQEKLTGGFLALIVMVVFLEATSLMNVYNQGKAHRLIDNGMRVADLSLASRGGILQAQHDVKDFLLHYKESGSGSWPDRSGLSEFYYQRHPGHAHRRDHHDTRRKSQLGEINDVSLSAGNYVKVSIQDRGIGIPAGYLPKIFDPYFTTKQKGSGLGLATAYSIVKNHNGHILVESKLGEGTTFHIYLPASDQKKLPQPEEDRKLLAGKGRILVMDDEELVREVLGTMLVNLGYEAEFAHDGMEAIKIFREAQENGDRFAAVILDLTVPGGMGGKESILQLRRIDPQIKAIVSSGYSDDPIMAEFRRHGFSGVIAKPYRVLDLSKTLHEIIQEASPN